MTKSEGVMRWLQAVGTGGQQLRGLPRTRAARSEDGATLVETALSFTVLLALLFGVIEACLSLYTFNYISDAAREGSRWAMVRGSQCMSLDHCSALSSDIQTYVQTLGYPGIDPSKMTVTTNWYTPSSSIPTTWTACTPGSTTVCNVAGNQVQVTVTYQFPFSIPFWKATTVNMHSTSTMVVSL